MLCCFTAISSLLLCSLQSLASQKVSRGRCENLQQLKYFSRAERRQEITHSSSGGVLSLASRHPPGDMSRFLKISTSDLDAEKGHAGPPDDSQLGRRARQLRKQVWHDRSPVARVAIVVVAIVMLYNALAGSRPAAREERPHGSPRLRSSLSGEPRKVPGPESVSYSTRLVLRLAVQELTRSHRLAADLCRAGEIVSRGPP